MALVPALAGGGRSRLRLLASTAFAVLRNAANASRAARGPRGSAVYTLGTNSGASPWRVGLESLSLLSAMPFALAAASPPQWDSAQKYPHEKRNARSYPPTIERGAPCPALKRATFPEMRRSGPNHTLKRDTFPGTRRHRPPYTRPLCATFPGTRRIPFLCNAKGRPTSRTA